MGWGDSRVLFFHRHQNDLEGPLICRGGGGLLPEFCLSSSDVGPEKRNAVLTSSQVSGEKGLPEFSLPFLCDGPSGKWDSEAHSKT